MEKRVLLSRIFPEIATQLLKEAGLSVTVWDKDRPMTQDEIIEKAKDHNALFCTVSDKVDKKFFSECSHLDIVSQFAVGYDNIDIAEATKLGIPVGYAPGAMTDATADTAFGLMIATSRKMFFNHKKIINGEWGFFKPTGNLGIELKNKTLGVFGFGRIGVEMSKRCKGAYNMNVLYHDLERNLKGEEELNAKYVDFNTLLSQSDVISVHCSLSRQTKDIFNKQAFEKMKPSAIFINTARGPVHNEADLIEALKQGKIWGAGLDVTNPEPMFANNPLLEMENVCILPHIGSATVEARNAMATLAALNIIEFYKNKKVPHIINPEVII
ncbi:MAG: D-glycerate dehydrogenase [Marinilabiliaceae bacterium]|nr:D-glycerate dehydrogenase [Marinilabiliaceae bacterium]